MAWASPGSPRSHDIDHPMRSVKVRIHNGNGHIILVDTPGFDDYGKNAEDILKAAYVWLRQKSVAFNNLDHK